MTSYGSTYGSKYIMPTIPNLPSSFEANSNEPTGVAALHDHAVELEQSASDLVNDVTLATTRINEALSNITTLMRHSDNVRTDMNEKYKNEHKFHGYLGVKNPKTLLRAMALSL
mmetsp:Transcript_4377/g.5363  ORF Transcript_4377/g.5363 Transcript_4377/m.5363 type:complete len:114 (-) Transcript_4377:77-418(-)